MIDFPKLYLRLTETYPRIGRLLPGHLVPLPLHVFIYLTYRCNLKCKMCEYIELQTDSRCRNREFSIDELKGLVDSTPSYALLSLTGGEVTLRKDLTSFLDYAAKKRKLQIISNGTNITLELAEKLVGYGCKSFLGNGLVLVSISLEGPEEVHDSITLVKGSFARTVAAYKNLIEARNRHGRKYPLVGMQVVIFENTVKTLAGMYALAQELGLDICNFSVINNNPYVRDLEHRRGEGLEYSPELPTGVDTVELRRQLDEIVRMSEGSKTKVRFSPSGITPDEIIRYYDGKSNKVGYHCLAPWSKATVYAHGELMICPFYSLGNVREKGFAEMWRSDDAQSFRNRLKSQGLFKGCTQCCMLVYKDDDR